MSRKKIQMGEVESGEISRRYRAEKDARSKIRLLCIKLAQEGAHSAREIASICGSSRAIVFEWIKAFRTGGFAGLLKREKPGPARGEIRGIPKKVTEELRKGVQTGRWATAQAARQWLLKAHGIRRPYITVYQWIKKLEGSCAFRGPSTRNKIPKRQKNLKINSRKNSSLFNYRKALE